MTTPEALPPLPPARTLSRGDEDGPIQLGYTADQMHAYARAALAAPQWQPIETAPKDGTCVMVWPPTWNDVASCAKWDRDEYVKRPRPYWRRIDDLGRASTSRDKPPTHWQPLPQPPKD